MATVKKPAGKPDHRAKTEKTERSPADSKPARRRRRWKLLFPLAALLLLVWFAPAIVARTALRQRIVPVLFPKFQGTCTIGEASLDWRRPIRLHNVIVDDKQGERLLTAVSLTSEKTLFELTTAPSRLGRFRIEQPELRVILRDDGSNVEDALALFLSDDDQPSGPVACSIEVAGGTAEIVDKRADRRILMKDLALSLEVPREQTSPTNLQLSAVLGEAPQPGHLKVVLSLGRASSPAGDGTLELESDGFRLDALRPLWERLGVGVVVSGELASNVQVKWGTDGDVGFWSVSGNATLKEPVFDAPDYLDGEQLELASLSTSGLFDYRGGQMGLNDVTVNSDVGSVTVSGTLDTKEFSDGATAAKLQSALENEDYSLTGDLDLAKLAALLPRTLRIRTGTKITSGKLTLALTGNVKEDVRHWTGHVRATDISAENAGRRLEWKQPIEIKLAAHRSSDGPVIDELRAQSEFLQLSASGTLQESQLTAHCDLQRLASELGRFVDLDDLRLAGKIEADFRCQLGQDDRARATGRLVADGFRWHGPGGRPWEEEHLVATLSGTGVVSQQKLREIAEAKITLVSGRDSLDVEQLQPVELTATAKVPVRVNLKGRLASWLSRLRPWLSTDDWDIGGEIDLRADASVSSEVVDVATATINLKALHAHGKGLFIDEPNVSIETSGTWDRAKNRFFSKMTTLAGNTISARAVDASVQLRDEGPPELSGGVAVRANLDRLIRTTRDPRTPSRQRVFGSATGNIKFSHSGQISRAVWRVDLEKLVVAQPVASAGGHAGTRQPGANAQRQWQSVFEDGPLSMTGRGDYDHARDVLNLSDLELTSTSLRLRTKGTVDGSSGQRRIDLSGEVDYDAEKLAGLFRGKLGEDFRMTGRQTRAFSLRGPLITLEKAASDTQTATNGWPRELSGRVGFGWDSAQALGMAIGAGELDLQLKTAVLTVKPIDVTVGEGRLKLSPRILLDRTPMLLVLDEGPMIENVRLSPEQGKSWLRYVAPIMAGATQVEGRFSVDLDGGKMPLPDPRTGDVAGTLKIHSAQVRSGPLIDQVVVLVRQIEGILRKGAAGSTTRPGTLLTMPEHDVPFRMVDGRVHHRGLTFSSGDVVIRTTGSVGFDETLILTAEVLIPDKWIGSDRLLAGLKGRALKIPIGGTLKRPQIDSRALAGLARQFAGSAANRWIENELGKQLDKLFEPKKK